MKDIEKALRRALKEDGWRSYQANNGAEWVRVGQCDSSFEQLLSVVEKTVEELCPIGYLFNKPVFNYLKF